MRQPDVDPHGLTDAPQRRRRRRLPYIIVGVVLAAVVLFVWLNDRQPSTWKNDEWGIALEFDNRFINLAADENTPSYPKGVLFGNAWVSRNNPGWDEYKRHFNGFYVQVEEPWPELSGLTVDQLVGVEASWVGADRAVADSTPGERTAIGGRPAVTFTTEVRIDGVAWRERAWIVPVGDLFYVVRVQAHTSDWEKESPALIAAAESLRIAEDAAP